MKLRDQIEKTKEDLALLILQRDSWKLKSIEGAKSFVEVSSKLIDNLQVTLEDLISAEQDSYERRLAKQCCNGQDTFGNYIVIQRICNKISENLYLYVSNPSEYRTIENGKEIFDEEKIDEFIAEYEEYLTSDFRKLPIEEWTTKDWSEIMWLELEELNYHEKVLNVPDILLETLNNTSISEGDKKRIMKGFCQAWWMKLLDI